MKTVQHHVNVLPSPSMHIDAYVYETVIPVLTGNINLHI